MPGIHSRRWTRLGPEERVALVRGARQGDPEARDRLVRASLKSVRAIARHYEGRGLPFEDLVSEGVLGVLRAIPAYDPDRGRDFMAFAVWRIRSAIGKGLTEESRTVRLPSYLADRVPKVRRAIAALRRSLGRDPTAEEVARAVPYTRSRATLAALARRLGRVPAPEEVREARRRRRVTPRVVARIMDYLESFPPERPLRRIRSEDDLPPAPDPLEEKIEAAGRRRAILSALKRLEPKEELILRLRYGIPGGPCGPDASLRARTARGGRSLTLREIGEHLLLTRERVRQIEAEAIRRMEVMLGQRGREL